ncbi:MAG: mechanosensitive ion channel family protein [Calothrix sp. FI2-JRJ7]|jgi:small conductance mechanosensitive channel|nr:mechanosensitive ion channel family protein [Calothrix sp. FI2-JRJ7]
MRFRFLAVASSIAVVTFCTVPKATGQINLLPNLLTPTSPNNDSENRVVNGWVYLDGRRLFQLAAARANLAERLENVQQNLNEASRGYFESSATEPKVEFRVLNGLPVIYLNNRYLMTVTSNDAELLQVDVKTAANQITQILRDDLIRAKQERSRDFLIHQGFIALGIGASVIIVSWGIHSWQCRLKRKALHSTIPAPTETPISTQLKQKQHQNLQEVRRRLFQLTQTGVWGSGTFVILGLFPYTRMLQVVILRVAQIPLTLGIVALGTYVVIRLSYALIDRFTSAIVSSTLLSPETPERLQLRISTISGVAKSIITIVWIGVGILLTLISLGIDIVPLLAGVSLVGVAVSLASQNLIKDAINGFLIILEDQYALGDVIALNNVSGFVETLNLRITQVRDSEGRLITIPNGEIKIVANLSSRWSRADLSVPVAYNTDISQALKLIETVAVDMDLDPAWQAQILETPKVLGVENFGERGLIIRVWIKTQPLKQWDVAREFRRRLKIAFDKAGISIPIPQQAIWINDGQTLNSK